MALKLIPRRYLEMVSAHLFSKDDMPEEVERYLYSYFEKDVLRLTTSFKRSSGKYGSGVISI